MVDELPVWSATVAPRAEGIADGRLLAPVDTLPELGRTDTVRILSET